MKFKKLIISFLMTFAITFITTAIVTLLWNLIIEKSGLSADWATSFRLALILGIVIPVVRKSE
jgi:hypothetical protein